MFNRDTNKPGHGLNRWVRIGLYTNNGRLQLLDTAVDSNLTPDDFEYADKINKQIVNTLWVMGEFEYTSALSDMSVDLDIYKTMFNKEDKNA